MCLSEDLLTNLSFMMTLWQGCPSLTQWQCTLVRIYWQTCPCDDLGTRLSLSDTVTMYLSEAFLTNLSLWWPWDKVVLVWHSDNVPQWWFIDKLKLWLTISRLMAFLNYTFITSNPGSHTSSYMYILLCFVLSQSVLCIPNISMLFSFIANVSELFAMKWPKTH